MPYSSGSPVPHNNRIVPSHDWDFSLAQKSRGPFGLLASQKFFHQLVAGHVPNLVFPSQSQELSFRGKKHLGVIVAVPVIIDHWFLWIGDVPNPNLIPIATGNGSPIR